MTGATVDRCDRLRAAGHDTGRGRFGTTRLGRVLVLLVRTH
jgi:hypothetical protein